MIKGPIMAGAADQKAERSYLSSAVESLTPWGAKRAPSPIPAPKEDDDAPPELPEAAKFTGSVDHSTTHLYGQSFRTYPPDCPPLNVQWFHAVDVPRRKPQLGKGPTKLSSDSKPPAAPKKFSAFSKHDSWSIESSYQKLLEATEDAEHIPSRRSLLHSFKSSTVNPNEGGIGRSFRAASKDDTNVPVNEDFLFDVNIEKRELMPAYWLGPVYEVRRGSWFFQEGSNHRPCEENLAAQLEEGYLKIKPWMNPTHSRSRSSADHIAPKTSGDSLKTESADLPAPDTPSKLYNAPDPVPSSSPQPQSYRLFGAYMNSSATYQDATTAWLSSETMLSWVTSSVYERFSGGGYMSGIKLVRGYSEPNKKSEREKEDKRDPSAAETITGLDERQQRLLKRRSAPPTTKNSNECQSDSKQPEDIEGSGARLRRHLSSLIENEGKTAEEKEEQLRKQQEQDIQDYHTQAGETQGRDVEHLILVTHGIGQQLSLRMESINFVHDVNGMRKTFKSVYANSADLKALNSESGDGPGNCRVQVLPVCWRHLLDFPKRRERTGKHDLGNIGEEEDMYPSLDDITVEGVAFARSLISDLALDILLYQSSYKEQISRIVLQECNRIFALFKQRNPDFRGKIHIMGHSLGSAILFDILCRQRGRQLQDDTKGPLRFRAYSGRAAAISKVKESELALDFDVADFYCLGSPIGLFQMLEGRTIAARRSFQGKWAEEVLGTGSSDDPYHFAPTSLTSEEISDISGLPLSVSSPNVEQLFNIFHPSDPISYRLEPLISPAMTTLKPQGLPYTKKGILDAANQGLTGIGTKVGQSVSGLWSSLSAGLANNMLNRSLGLSNEEVARLTDQAQAAQRDSSGAGINILAGGIIGEGSEKGEKADERKKRLAETTGLGGPTSPSGNDLTLIDDEIQTLFAQFQKQRTEMTQGEQLRVGQGQEHEYQREAAKIRLEESKIRRLNRNGRVDYSIQESVLDFNPMNTIASHMGYWADVDVNHFILSQLLANRSNKRE